MIAKTMTLSASLPQVAPTDLVRTNFFSVINSETPVISGTKLENGNKHHLFNSRRVDPVMWRLPLVKQNEMKQECLKYDKLDDKRYSPKRSVRDYDCTQARKKPRKSISFAEVVEVLPIPAKDEYESPVKEKLWANIDEIQQNAARNMVEFISEGWNWRTVMEDEGMHLCVVTGERIHPVHYANLGIEPGEFVP